MNWLANKPTRLRDKTLVTLSIAIFIDGEAKYFPWTEEGFAGAYKMMYKHYDELTNDDNSWVAIVADEGFEWCEPMRVTRKELSQKDWYKWYQFQRGVYGGE